MDLVETPTESEEPMFFRGMLSLPEAAAIAHCSASSFRHMARAGCLPFRSQRDTNQWLVDQGSFDDWVRARQGERAGEKP